MAEVAIRKSFIISMTFMVLLLQRVTYGQNPATCDGLDEFIRNTMSSKTTCTRVDPLCSMIMCRTVDPMFSLLVESSKFTLLPCEDPPSIALLIVGSAPSFNETLNSSRRIVLANVPIQMGGSILVELNITLDHSIPCHLGIEVDLLQEFSPSGQMDIMILNRYTSIPLDTSSCGASHSCNLPASTSPPTALPSNTGPALTTTGTGDGQSRRVAVISSVVVCSVVLLAVIIVASLILVCAIVKKRSSRQGSNTPPQALNSLRKEEANDYVNGAEFKMRDNGIIEQGQVVRASPSSDFTGFKQVKLTLGNHTEHGHIELMPDSATPGHGPIEEDNASAGHRQLQDNVAAGHGVIEKDNASAGHRQPQDKDINSTGQREVEVDINDTAGHGISTVQEAAYEQRMRDSAENGSIEKMPSNDIAEYREVMSSGEEQRQINSGSEKELALNNSIAGNGQVGASLSHSSPPQNEGVQQKLKENGRTRTNMLNEHNI